MATALPGGVPLEDALAAILLSMAALGLVAVGAGVCWLGVDRLRSFWSTAGQRAEQVRGTVVTTRVDEHLDASGDGAEFDFEPVVEYEFEYYDGETYSSRNLFPGAETVPPCDGRGAAASIVAPYEAGDRVTVHVPGDPEAAYLEVPTVRDSLDMVLRYLGVVALGAIVVGFGLLAGREAYLALAGTP